jgi:formamidopyrimidine-DNA glycosylase
MPELADVEGYRRYLSRYAKGKRIEGVEAPATDLLRNTTASALGRALRGRRFAAPDRHGKWLIAPTDGDPAVLMHFGMTGDLGWSGDGPAGRHPHDRVVFRLAGDEELRYRNMRKFGGIWLARSDSEIGKITGPLGPDALDLDREALEGLLASRRGGVKAALMNQRLLAGIGNELSDEILWRARIHPAKGLGSLDRRARDRIFEAMREVLTESVRHGRIPRKPGWIEEVRGAPDARCPRCGAKLRRTTVAGRTAYWCPRDQRRG